MNRKQRACQRSKSVSESMEMALINEWMSVLNQLVENIVILWDKDKHFNKIQDSYFSWVELWFSSQTISFLWWLQFFVSLLACFLAWREIQWSPFFVLVFVSLLADKLTWYLLCSNNSIVPLVYMLVPQLCYWNKRVKDNKCNFVRLPLFYVALVTMKITRHRMLLLFVLFLHVLYQSVQQRIFLFYS